MDATETAGTAARFCSHAPLGLIFGVRTEADYYRPCTDSSVVINDNTIIATARGSELDDQLEIARNAGNVSDLGAPSVATEALKAMLAGRIAAALEQRGLSVRAAERDTGFAAADYSRIRQKRLDRFTVDRLMAMLGSLDPSIELSVLVRPMLTREWVVEKLKGREEEIRAEGVTALYLFGSAARNEAGSESDVDILLDYDPSRFEILRLIDIKLDLEAQLGVPVHVSSRDSLKPEVRESVEREALRVF
jgi:uncharacterized protein